MATQLLSFTRTMTERDIHAGMLGALLRVASERDLTTIDAEADTALARQLVTMAAAYSDLSAQLGICPPAAIERVLTGLPID